MTLRELLIMGESHSRAAWAHTSALLALVANAFRDPKKGRAFQPADFNPHLRTKEPPVAKVGITALKEVFVRETRNAERGMRN